MDLSFANAVRNASNAWAQNRATDALTLRELVPSYVPPQPPQQPAVATVPTAGQMAVLQPELARYGQLGTKLNLYA